MGFKSADRMTEFTRKWHFFTPAIPYLWGRFTDEPLVQFLSEYSKPAHFLTYKFQQPIFTGLSAPNGDVDWNFALWGLENEAWPEFEAFMLSLAFMGFDNSVTRFGVNTVNVFDPLWLDKGGLALQDSPRLDIEVFGIDSTAGAIYIPAGKCYTYPAVKRTLPQARTVDFAEAIRVGNNPNEVLNG